MSAMNKRGLEYSISIEKDLLVVSFSGQMTEENSSILYKCQSELNTGDGKYVILNFGQVTEFSEDIIGTLRGLQSSIRRKPAHIRVCCVRPEWKKILFESNIFHRNEINEGLESTLENITSIS